MRVFSSFFKNDFYNYKDVRQYAKMIASSAFFSQNTSGDFILYTDSFCAPIFKEFVFARKNIKILPVENQVPNYPRSFWSFPKIYTAFLQKEPFISIDVDAFPWKPISFETDFFFYSVDKHANGMYGPYYAIGLKALKELGALPSCLEGIDVQNVSFPIFNLGVFGCKNQAIFERYMAEVNSILPFSEKIDAFVSKTPIIRGWRVSTAISVTLEQLLLSKVIADGGQSCSYFYKDLTRGRAFPSSSCGVDKIPFTHLMGAKFRKTTLSYIDNLYEQIRSAGNHSIAYFIQQFLFEDGLAAKVTWGEELKAEFLSERGSAKCSSCKEKRIKRKYQEIATNRFFNP